MALAKEAERWSPTTLREKLIKIGTRVVRYGHYVTFQLAEVAIPRALFAKILRRIDGLRPAPLPPLRFSVQKHLGLPTVELHLVSVEVRPPIMKLAAQRQFNRQIGQPADKFAMRNANQALYRFRQPNVLPLFSPVRGAIWEISTRAAPQMWQNAQRV